MNMTNVVAQAVTADTMRTTAGCGSSASSAMVGGAWIAVGSRILSLTSAGSSSAIRPWTECSTSFATDTIVANVIFTPTIRFRLRSGGTYDSISTTSGRDAMAVTARRRSGSAQETGRPVKELGPFIENHWLLPHKEAQVLRFFLLGEALKIRRILEKSERAGSRVKAIEMRG